MSHETKLRDRTVDQLELHGTKMTELETPAAPHDAACEKWGLLAECVNSLGFDYHDNIVKLTATCGELLKADFARYSRIEAGRLIPVSTWKASGVDPDGQEPDESMGFEEFSNSREDFVVVRNLSPTVHVDTDQERPCCDLRTCAMAPVKTGTQIVGCLATWSRSDWHPNGNDRDLMRTVAAAIGSEERHRQSDDVARRDRQMLKSILWSSPLGIGYFVEGKLKWTNPAMAKMFGAQLYDQDLGQRPREFYSSETEYQRVRQEFYRFLENGEPAEMEALLRRRDGTTFHGHLKISAVDPSHPRRGTITTVSDISARKCAEEALKESEERYRLLADNSLTGIYIHQDGRFVYVNDRMAEMLGYAPGEVIGRDFWDFVHPKDRELVKKRGIARSRGIRVSPHYEFRVRNKSGETRIFEIMATTIVYRRRTANMGNVADITRRKEAEDELRTSREDLRKLYEKARKAEDQYRSLLESSPAAIVIYDLEGRARFVNDSFVRIFGWRREELIGHRVPFVPESEQDESMSLIRRLIQDGVSTSGFETKRYTKDGSLVDVAINASGYHDHEGKLAGLLVILADISERKRAEELFLQAERLKALGELASGVAHNFNNLLQIVVSSAQTALLNIESGDLEEAANKLGIILQSSAFGSETVKRLQYFSRIRTTRKDNRGNVFDLAQTAEKAAEMIRPWFDTKLEKEGIEIELHTELSGSCPVQGDESEMFEVLINLIKNATEALVRGGVIRIACANEGDDVVLTVQDNGVGISPENLEKVFDPFWTSKEFHAVGMGLASCLGIVRQHRGVITVLSELDRGSTFTLRFPRAKETHSVMEHPIETPPASTLRLLLIDDVEPVVLMLREGLEELGQVVYTATSAKDGIGIYSQTPVDVVVCDLGMPEMDGWQVGKAIKDICTEKGIPKTPFILLTGWSEQLDDPGRMAAAGVNRVLGKPVVLTELLQAVRDLAGRET